MQTAGFVFLVGAVMAYAFRVWTIVIAALLLAAGEAIWQLAQGTGIWSTLGGIALHSLALQSGYFFGLIFAYLYAHPEILQSRARTEISPAAQPATQKHQVAE